MQTRYQNLLRFALSGSALLLLNICYLIGFSLSSGYGIFPVFFSHNHSLIFTINILWLLLANNQVLKAYLRHQFQFNFAGFLNNESFYIGKDKTIVTHPSGQFRLAASQDVKDIFMPLPRNKMRELPKLSSEAEKNHIRLKFVSDYDVASAELEIEQMEGLAILSVRKEPLDDAKNQFIKRAFDVVFSCLVIVFILSWLCPIIALIIKLESRGDVIFKQLRTGKDNVPFVCYKFRTLLTGNYDEKKQVCANDARVTPFGNFLRRTSLDELPQFFNVLLGNMSVIGPRPHMVEHTEHYAAIIDGYMIRQVLKPGITGWAQVNGFRGPTNEIYLMKKRVEHDIWYKENWTVTVDLKIVLMTIFNMVKGEKNAY